MQMRSIEEKILDNTITDAELEEFYQQYNTANGAELDTRVKSCVKYLNNTQLYLLCKRLIPLEAKFNGADRFLRNKSPATLCITALMNSLHYPDQLLQQFTACAASHDFLLEEIQIPEFIKSLFHLAYALFTDITEENKAKLAANIVFFLITTPIVNTALQQVADSTSALKIITAIKELTANTKSTLYGRFYLNLRKQIAQCPIELAAPVTKSTREIANDCFAYTNEVKQMSMRDKGVLLSWPSIFRKIQNTSAVEDSIQENRCHKMFEHYYGMIKPDNLNVLDRAVCDTVAMMDAIMRNHKNWITPSLVDLVKSIYLKAAGILQLVEKDHRMTLLEIEISVHLKQLPDAKAIMKELKTAKSKRH